MMEEKKIEHTGKDAEDVAFERSQTRKATEAKCDRARRERLELINEGFEWARELLPDIQEPKELKEWMVAVGTLIDRRRMEEGAASPP